MAKTSDQVGQNNPGVGHNKPKVVWERWVKKRTFVRALEGTYGEMQQGLYEKQRV